MGIVYQAEHTVMERLVALKVVSRQLLDSPEAVERFGREVRAAARLDHPNIVRAYDAEQADDLQLLVMEYVEGKSLSDVLDRKGPLPIAHACQYIRQAALGLQHAHEKGMVHRDLKPSNLMLTPKGVVKILDFGLAKLNSERKRGAELTRKDMAMGTPEYMAPEQALDTKNADIRADIYALGCTLYCLLAGRPPFRSADGNDLQVIMAHIDQEPPPVTQFRPDVPPDLAALLTRMLAKAPEQRPQIPKQVADAVAAIAKGAPEKSPRHSAPAAVAAPSVGRLETKSSAATPFADLTLADSEQENLPKQRSRWLIPVVAVAGTLLVGAVVAGLIFASGSRHRADATDVTLNNKGTNEKVAPEPRPVEAAPKPVESPPEPKATKSEPPATAQPPVPAPEATDGFLPLFQGKDLTGWYVEKGDARQWRVEGDAIVARSAGPPTRNYLLSLNEYADFMLRLEFMIDPGANGGITLRAIDGEKLPAANGAFIADHPMIKLTDSTRFLSYPLGTTHWLSDDRIDGRPSEPLRLATGTWHQLEVTIRGDHCIARAGGTQFLDIKLNPDPRASGAIVPALKRARGKIGFQVHTGTLRFRSVAIKELPVTPSEPQPPPVTSPAPSRAERIASATAQLRSVERDLEGLDFIGQTPETQTRKTLKQGALIDVRGAIKAIDDGRKGKDVQGYIDRAREKIQRLEAMINPPKTATNKGKAASQKRKETVGHAETLLDEVVKTLIEANVLDPRP
jgi:serine/threonine protein kinase